MNLGVKKINVAGGNQIGNIEPASHQELIEVPGSPRKDAGGLGSNPVLELVGLKGLEESYENVQGDGLIAQSEAEIADQSLGRVIFGILFQDVSIRGDCFSGSCHNLRSRCR